MDLDAAAHGSPRAGWQHARPMRAAAVQQEPVIADVAANLAACERLADEAGLATRLAEERSRG